MATAPSSPDPRLTPQQYLVLERQAAFRSEYHNGQLVGMSGASRNHNLITSNLVRILGNQLLDRPCEVYSSDMRVAADRKRLYTYPDVVVVCGTPRFRDGEQDTLVNPTVLFEILSPTTELHDRSFKLRGYLRIPSLKAYVLISQVEAHIELYTRQDESWVLSDCSELTSKLVLDAIGCALPLAEVYARVEFPPVEPEPEEDEPPQA